MPSTTNNYQSSTEERGSRNLHKEFHAGFRRSTNNNRIHVYYSNNDFEDLVHVHTMHQLQEMSCGTQQTQSLTLYSGVETGERGGEEGGGGGGVGGG